MRKQETFDIVVQHLRQQNKKSIDEEGNCLYRNSDGLKCAAGCLILDEEYVKEMEGMTIAIGYLAGDVISNHGHNLDLVFNLQDLHDHSKINEWEDGFRDIALSFNLEYKEPASG